MLQLANLDENTMEVATKATFATNMASGAATTYLGLTADSVHILIGFVGLGISVATFCVHLYFSKKRFQLEKERNV